MLPITASNPFKWLCVATIISIADRRWVCMRKQVLARTRHFAELRSEHYVRLSEQRS